MNANPRGNDLSISRRHLIGGGLFVLASPHLASHLTRLANSPPNDLPDLISPPADRFAWPQWRQDLKAWRQAQQVHYNDSIYRQPESQWGQTCYCCHKIMTWDEAFLDSRAGKYKVEEYLEMGQKVFGGFDAVVLWQAYPRIGFDERNQFDFYRGLPGGLPGLADAVKRFHASGVKVFIDYNPWDTGTRRETTSDEVAIADIVKAIDADGVFLDTMTKGASSMRTALDVKKKGVVFETELPLPLEGVEFNQLSWAQWLDKTAIPGVLRDHWLERRHMMHAIRRWDTDHTNEIQMAWMNGAGVLVWENVFGSWNPWSDENCTLLRQILPIQRHFSPFFLHGEWDPLVETTQPVGSPQPKVCASTWTQGEDVLWTATNIADQPVPEGWMESPQTKGAVLLDLVRGRQVSVVPSIGPHGIAALLSIPASKIDTPLKRFLSAQADAAGSTLKAGRARTVRAIDSPRPPSQHLAAPDMRSMPGGTFNLKCHFRARECGERGYGNYANQVYPELHADVEESHRLVAGPFAISGRDVSNREYGEFLAATGYAPRVKDSFLKHWSDPEKRQNDEPVVFVTVDDAHAYAKWKGGRLPTDLEWQLIMDILRLGRGSFAVWNWTSSQFTDDQTRFVLIKGGSDFEAKGSIWYADGGIKEPNFVAKFIQIWPGLDRCSTIGFRYVVDLH